MGKFIITKRKDQEFQFNLIGGNGENILTSEGYTQKASCHKGIESVRVNSQDDLKYDRRLSTDKKDYFVLKAGNGEIIGVSQLYSSRESMEKGIASVKSNSPTAEITDETLKN
ncbi:YegP family protein [Chryseobacterium phocaeense]|uniref:YegP family protein n=1 Tax=Chryseobacterium phocaeense TaxID=1816690 RepID=UPI0009B9F811|nr:YegP family protein [Chryseobacterium phocaeense]